MGTNNLRIIYKNLADVSTITASSSAGVTLASNLKLDAKALIWRSVGTTATLTVAFGSTKSISGVVLPFTNLTATATIKVTITGGTTYNTGVVLACPYQSTDSWDSTFLPSGSSMYSYGGGTYARVWFPVQTGTGVTIEIIDTANTSGYIEASRLVLGEYWSPKYNTGFGMAISKQDLSTNSRTESGDLVTNRGIRFKSLSFDLSWLAPTDRTTLVNLLGSNGMAKPILISLFPDCTEDYNKEQLYQIFGKLSQQSDITHPMFGIYSSKIDIEEI